MTHPMMTMMEEAIRRSGRDDDELLHIRERICCPQSFTTPWSGKFSGPCGVIILELSMTYQWAYRFTATSKKAITSREEARKNLNWETPAGARFLLRVGDKRVIDHPVSDAIAKSRLFHDDLVAHKEHPFRPNFLRNPIFVPPRSEIVASIHLFDGDNCPAMEAHFAMYIMTSMETRLDEA